MHAEIKKFWEDAGYSIGRLFISFDISCQPMDAAYYWTVSKNEIGIPFIVAISLFNGTIKYCLYGERYSEEEMLRIIKLKYFL